MDLDIGNDDEEGVFKIDDDDESTILDESLNSSRMNLLRGADGRFGEENEQL